MIMTRKDLKIFNHAQIEEIRKYKWIESEKACRDIGDNEAAMEWIERFGHAFREYWYDIVLKGRNN
jgi:hypothetical protein